MTRAPCNIEDHLQHDGHIDFSNTYGKGHFERADVKQE